jgi:hypothetical protein
MTTNSSTSRDNLAEATKPSQKQNPSEPIEPHEVAAGMTEEQMGRFLDELMKLAKSK